MSCGDLREYICDNAKPAKRRYISVSKSELTTLLSMVAREKSLYVPRWNVTYSNKLVSFGQSVP